MIPRMFEAQAFVVLHDAPQHGAADEVGPNRVLQASVYRTSVDQIGKPELEQVAKPLELGSVN
jgi:hypothetical protein